ncbi:MAG: hypothetical protein SAL07_13000 [Oscillatoria sp. PMC 1051.18]|nr:hypothetical protein [Oscillatoria sp. PMC 1051.18]
MKVLLHTETKLVLRHYPLLTWEFTVLFLIIGIVTFLIPIVDSDQRLIAHLVAWIFIIFTVFFALSKLNKVVVWSFDKSIRTLFVEERGLLNTTVSEYAFREIRNVQIETELDQPLYSISLILSDNRKLNLCLDYSLFANVAEERVNCISTFLAQC